MILLKFSEPVQLLTINFWAGNPDQLASRVQPCAENGPFFKIHLLPEFLFYKRFTVHSFKYRVCCPVSLLPCSYSHTLKLFCRIVLVYDARQWYQPSFQVSMSLSIPCQWPRGKIGQKVCPLPILSSLRLRPGAYSRRTPPLENISKTGNDYKGQTFSQHWQVPIL